MKEHARTSQSQLFWVPLSAPSTGFLVWCLCEWLSSRGSMTWLWTFAACATSNDTYTMNELIYHNNNIFIRNWQFFFSLYYEHIWFSMCITIQDNISFISIHKWIMEFNCKPCLVHTLQNKRIGFFSFNILTVAARFSSKRPCFCNSLYNSPLGAYSRIRYTLDLSWK